MKKILFMGIVLFLLVNSGVLYAEDAPVFSDSDLSRYGQKESSEKEVDSPAMRAADKRENMDAYNFCVAVIKSKLKTPSVARFHTLLDVSPDQSVSNEGTYYKVFGSVDSQNSYGAMLTSRFYCRLYKDGAGRWQVADANLL